MVQNRSGIRVCVPPTEASPLIGGNSDDIDGRDETVTLHLLSCEKRHDHADLCSQGTLSLNLKAIRDQPEC